MQSYVRLLGITFIIIVLATTGFSQNMFRKMNDFDGDGKTDFAVTRREGDSKVWYILQSRDGFRAFQWGTYNDVNVSGDYDGDGKTDIAIFRTENFPNPTRVPGFWIWSSASNAYTRIDFPGFFRVNYPVPQDYNGDGKTDLALWMGDVQEPPGSVSTNVYGKYSGTNEDITFRIPPYSSPLRLGDMTGDGRADNVYSFSQSNNRGVNISDIATGATRFVAFGITGDRFIPGDFDGDGIGDLAIWRSSDGNWWWLRSSDNTVRVVNWGASGDTPVPGDYDGDGITDLAIWRRLSGQGYYWVYGSQNGISVVPWGISTDTIVEP